MSEIIQRIYLIFFCLLLSLSAQASPQKPKLPTKPDVRLIIDISGSMKHTDPHNLRRPAVRMVSRLLPDGSHAGVWTFGHEVNMLVPYGKVDKAWREKAVKRASRINSVGLYTNIGKALSVASDDFHQNHQYDHTHFILLTDGKVDLPGGLETDAKARHRILTSVLQRIKSHGAHIDTIALSPDADKGLLKRLAVDSGGTFAIANNADQLSRAFLQALDNASPSEQVPISRNKFQVDKTVREFTALVFHKPGSQKTQLVRPDGKKVGADNHPARVHWLHEKAYDLITVHKPMGGTWHINAQLKPKSRVTVVSNFRMAVSELPANIYPEDRLDLGVAFYDKNSQVTDKDFLKLISIDVTISDNHGRSGTKTISNPHKAPDNGVYHTAIANLGDPGTYQVKVNADGKTFQRAQTQTITLRAPVDVEVHGQGNGNKSRYKISVIPQDPKLDLQHTQVRLRYQTPSGETTTQPLAFDAVEKQWQGTLKATAGQGNYRVGIRVEGRTGNGTPVHFSPQDFTATFPRKNGSNAYVDLGPKPVSAPKSGAPTSAPVVPKPVKPVSVPVSKPASSPEPASSPAAAPTKASEPEKTSEPVPKPKQGESHWLRWTGIAIALLLVVGGAVAGFLFWRRRRVKQDKPSQEQDAAQSTEQAPEEKESAAPEPETETEQEEPALAELDEAKTQIDTASDEAPPSDEAGRESDSQADIQDPETPEQAQTGSPEQDEAIPLMEESVPESEQEPEPEPQAEADPHAATDAETTSEEQADNEQAASESDAVVEDMDAESLADQILEENAQEDDDYSLEDFDIGELDDLPDESRQSSDDGREDGAGKGEKDDKEDKGDKSKG